MSVLRAFLDDLTARPSRETALIFADWLQDNGEPERAAAICAVVSRGLKKRVDKVPEFARWRLRCWPIPCLSSITSTMYGLVTGVRCSWDEWLAFGPGIVAAHPINRVDIKRAAPYRYHSGQPPLYCWLCFKQDGNLGPGFYGPNTLFFSDEILLNTSASVPAFIAPYVDLGPFTTVTQCEQYLSRTCITWAKEQVS